LPKYELIRIFKKKQTNEKIITAIILTAAIVSRQQISGAVKNGCISFNELLKRYAGFKRADTVLASTGILLNGI